MQASSSQKISVNMPMKEAAFEQRFHPERCLCGEFFFPMELTTPAITNFKDMQSNYRRLR